MLLYSLQDKLSLLIKEFNLLKERDAALQKKVASLELERVELKKEVQQLEETLIIKKMGSEGNQDALKAYIDRIIEEIDITIKKL